ncbi:MAG: serine O-acetyltransferase [Clostridia bacterium]|nr:serine O-acetyltransferase [Clostridia bacterium]
MFKKLRADINFAKKIDPAARSKFEIWLTYSGVHALSWHRVAYFFHKIRFRLLARIISQTCRFFTGIEIHPAAKIAGGVFIDHGAGVVIGETAEIEEGVVIYQGATLGGTGKEKGKRHPTVKKGAVISAGAKILGGFTVGEYAKIGAGAVVLKEVPPYATVVGVPGMVVRINGEKPADNMQQEKRDPILEEICRLRERVYNLEEKLKDKQTEKDKTKTDENINEANQNENL